MQGPFSLDRGVHWTIFGWTLFHFWPAGDWVWLVVLGFWLHCIMQASLVWFGPGWTVNQLFPLVEFWIGKKCLATHLPTQHHIILLRGSNGCQHSISCYKYSLLIAIQLKDHSNKNYHNNQHKAFLLPVPVCCLLELWACSSTWGTLIRDFTPFPRNNW